MITVHAVVKQEATIANKQIIHLLGGKQGLMTHPG